KRVRGREHEGQALCDPLEAGKRFSPALLPGPATRPEWPRKSWPPRPARSGAARQACSRTGGSALIVQSRATLLVPAIRLSDGGNLFGHINAYRAPGDAAAAADTAGDIELVIPGSKFMSEPLAITAADAGPEVAAVHVGKFRVETAIPAADALGIFQAQVGDVLH